MAKKNTGNVAIILMATILLSILIISVLIICDKRNSDNQKSAYSFNMFYKRLLKKYPKISLLGERFKKKLQNAYNIKHNKNIKFFVVISLVIILVLAIICAYLVIA